VVRRIALLPLSRKANNRRDARQACFALAPAKRAGFALLKLRESDARQASPEADKDGSLDLR
jgi:hypothetical protein